MTLDLIQDIERWLDAHTPPRRKFTPSEADPIRDAWMDARSALRNLLADHKARLNSTEFIKGRYKGRKDAAVAGERPIGVQPERGSSEYADGYWEGWEDVMRMYRVVFDG